MKLGDSVKVLQSFGSFKQWIVGYVYVGKSKSKKEIFVVRDKKYVSNIIQRFPIGSVKKFVSCYK